MAQKELQGAVACPGFGHEARGLAGEFRESLARRINEERRGGDQVGDHAGDRGPPRRGHRGHGLFIMSFWVVTIISTIRFQTFSTNAIARLSSASLGSCRRSSLRPNASGLTPPGRGRLW